MLFYPSASSSTSRAGRSFAINFCERNLSNTGNGFNVVTENSLNVVTGIGRRCISSRAEVLSSSRTRILSSSSSSSSTIMSSSMPKCSAKNLLIRRANFFDSSRANFSTGPFEAYAKLLEDGKINKDPNQEVIVGRLQELSDTLKSYHPVEMKSIGSAVAKGNSVSNSGGGGGFFGSLFGGGGGKPEKVAPPPPEPKINFTSPKGLYIWGGCGSGKSFLMDLFYETQTHIDKKRRVHFHEWLIEVHDRLHKKSAGTGHAKADQEWSATAAKAQRESLKSGGSSVDKAGVMESIADDMIAEAWLYCFDEFQVTHISDAMIMKQLFSILFRKGAVVVSTSNRSPEDLYLNGLNRPLFLPFIPLLKERCEVIDIASQTDYRLLTDYGEDAFQVFFSPINDKQRAFFDGKFERFTRGNVITDTEMEVQGRRLPVPAKGEKVQVAKFNFHDLCDKALGANDYINIAKKFHTVFIDNIPALTLQERDQVRRFITLIDTLYEAHTKFVIISEKPAAEIFSVDPSVDKKTAVQDEIFAWDRTVSRLTEMSSIDYLRKRSQELSVEQFWLQYDLSVFTDEEIDEIWQRFDVDLSGELDREELRVILEEILQIYDGKKTKDELSVEDFDFVWTAFDIDSSGTIDKDEFRSYVKKYSLQKIPPFDATKAGSLPELKVFQEGAKLVRKKSTELLLQNSASTKTS